MPPVTAHCRIYAMVTRDGTAIAEAALCDEHYREPFIGYALQIGKRCDDVGGDLSFHDCTDTEGLRCGECGVDAGSEIHFCATFVPRAWIRGCAVDVDPQGPVTWDCTEAVLAQWPYFQRLREEQDGFGDAVSGGLVDTDLCLAEDPAAPSWVRRWIGHGPSTIHVHRTTGPTAVSSSPGR